MAIRIKRNTFKVFTNNLRYAASKLYCGVGCISRDKQNLKTFIKYYAKSAITGYMFRDPSLYDAIRQDYKKELETEDIETIRLKICKTIDADIEAYVNKGLQRLS